MEYPRWLIALGWGSCLISIVCIPIYFVYKLSKMNGSFKKVTITKQKIVWIKINYFVISAHTNCFDTEQLGPGWWKKPQSLGGNDKEFWITLRSIEHKHFCFSLTLFFLLRCLLFFPLLSFQFTIFFFLGRNNKNRIVFKFYFCALFFDRVYWSNKTDLILQTLILVDWLWTSYGGGCGREVKFHSKILCLQSSWSWLNIGWCHWLNVSWQWGDVLSSTSGSYIRSSVNINWAQVNPVVQ